ncbi:MAG: hypothetical protein F6K56_31885 [Moorea sp. SIO3G5]|nr:hypothetical protein [Moorena sp. SIO3G5]
MPPLTTIYNLWQNSNIKIKVFLKSCPCFHPYGYSVGMKARLVNSVTVYQTSILIRIGCGKCQDFCCDTLKAKGHATRTEPLRERIP